MARHLDIVDAVVAALNGHSFGVSFTAVRRPLPLVTLEECQSSLVVTVAPSTFATEVADRSRRRSSYGVDVVLQKAVDPTSDTAFEALFDVLEAVTDFFAMTRLDGLQAAQPPDVAMVPGAEAGYAYQHLDEQRKFTGIVRLTFDVTEAR